MHWRAQREQLRSQVGQLPLVSAWIAFLVITDNCTLQCLGVPLFVAGAKVTAELVVAALRSLLPFELQFLITDRGVHFTAQVFQQLAREEQFIQCIDRPSSPRVEWHRRTLCAHAEGMASRQGLDLGPGTGAPALAVSDRLQ